MFFFSGKKLCFLGKKFVRYKRVWKYMRVSKKNVFKKKNTRLVKIEKKEKKIIKMEGSITKDD